MSDIHMHEMRTQDDAAEMRAVRNQVRSFMTHNQNEISDQEQREWFAETYLPARWRRQMFGFVVRDESEDPIGYGLISEREDKMWISGGLLPEARGKGAGRALFSFLTEFTHGYIGRDEVWLDVLKENERAHNLYVSLGYIAVKETEDVIVMVHQRLEEAA